MAATSLLNLWTSALVALVFCSLLTSTTYVFSSHRRYRGFQLTSRRRTWNRWTSSGLFVSRTQVQNLQLNRTLEDLFVLDSSEVAFPLEGSCVMAPAASQEEEEEERAEEEETMKMMPKCDEAGEEGDDEEEEEAISTFTLGCCRTVMQVEFPQIVTSVLSGLRHQVLQFAASSQLVHTGHCARERAGCSLGGTCTTFHRIQWLLVRGTPLPINDDDDGSPDNDDDGETTATAVNPGLDLFVPAMVPNHCQCVFS